MIAIFFILIGGLISFLITSAFVYLICWAFGLVFTFKLAFGIWLIYLLSKFLME